MDIEVGDETGVQAGCPSAIRVEANSPRPGWRQGKRSCRQKASQSLSLGSFQRRNHFSPWATCAISSR